MLVQQNRLALLHTFEVTAMHLSFTRAAADLHLTQGPQPSHPPPGGVARFSTVYPHDAQTGTDPQEGVVCWRR